MKKKEFNWFDYITNGLEKEPRTTGDMIARAFRAFARTLIFTMWLFWKALKFVIIIIKELIRMVFRKKKEPDLAHNLAQFGQQFGHQPQYQQPQQPQYPQQQYPQQPIQQQQYPQQQYPQQPIQQPPIPQAPVPEGDDNPFSVIIDALTAISAKIGKMDEEIFDMQERLNMIQGIQSTSTKRVMFRK